MDKKQVTSGGGTFIICLLFGIIFGLLLGGGAAKATNGK